MKRRAPFILEIGNRRIELGRRTIIMGVVNVTPDSFSDGGHFLDPDRAIAHGLELVRQGADWVDVGGESTRPGAQPVPAKEELRRIWPVIRGLRRARRNLPISVDTTKAEVAEEAVRAGADIINDVSGLRFDERMAEVARRHRTPLVLAHLRGRPQTMQLESFPRSIWRSLRAGLTASVHRALRHGVHRSQLIIDPGFGFGKSRRQNYEILAHLERLQEFRLPILVGTSRKSFVQAIAAGEDVASRKERKLSSSRWPLLQGEQSALLTAADGAAVVAAILAGAHIVRIHDVAALRPAIRLADAVLEAG